MLMKIVRILITLAIIAGLSYGGYRAYATFWPKKKANVAVPTTKVQNSEFVMKVSEIGKVKARKSIQVSAPFAGKIIKLCKEGSIVKKGDFLAQMDTTELVRKDRDEKLDLEQCTADVQKAEEELRIMKISGQLDLQQKLSLQEYDKSELEDAKAKFERKARLQKEEIVTLQDVDEEAIKVRSKKLSVKKDNIDVEIAKKKSLSDEKKKQAEINMYKLKAKKKQLDADAAQENLNKATIKAPEGGIVVFNEVWRSGQMSKLAEGDDVHRMESIIEIPDLSSLLVVVPVRETDIHRVKVGNETQIKLEADPNAVFHGKVEKIDRLAKEPHPWENPTAPGQKTFDVTVAIKDKDISSIRPGMTANTDIIEKKIKKTLFLPIECVFYREGKKFVYVKTGETFAMKEVDVGDRNENFVVITKGLSGKEEVALRDPTKSLEESEVSSKQEKGNGSSPVDMVPKKSDKKNGK